MGPTLVSYLCGAGAARTRAWETVVVAAAATVGVPWLAAGAAVAGCIAAATARWGPGLESLVREGEEVRTLGLWLCPPCVLAMPRLEKGRSRREWEEECVPVLRKRNGLK